MNEDKLLVTLSVSETGRSLCIGRVNKHNQPINYQLFILYFSLETHEKLGKDGEENKLWFYPVASAFAADVWIFSLKIIELSTVSVVRSLHFRFSHF